jgi:hypothetical protein
VALEGLYDSQASRQGQDEVWIAFEGRELSGELQFSRLTWLDGNATQAQFSPLQIAKVMLNTVSSAEERYSHRSPEIFN